MQLPAAGPRHLHSSKHWSRYFDASFMSLWLIFWLIGEVFALALMGSMLASALSAALGRPSFLGSWAPPTDGAVSVFLLGVLIWVALWTAAGAAAIWHFLRSLAGEDIIDVSVTGIHLTRRAGPMRRQRVISRAVVRRIRIRQSDQWVVADTDEGVREISNLGTPEERESLSSWLASSLLLPSDAQAVDRERERPPVNRDVDVRGSLTIVTQPTRRDRRLRARVVMVVAAVMALGWIDALRRGLDAITAGEVSAVIVTALVAALAIWSLNARSEWAIESGRLDVRLRFMEWILRERSFSAATIHLDHHRDSDGDDRYTLVIRDGPRQVTLATQVFDQYDLLALGEWLSARTGFPFARPSPF